MDYRDTEHEYRAKVAMGRKCKKGNPEPSIKLSKAQRIEALEKNIRAYRFRIDGWEKQINELKAKL